VGDRELRGGGECTSCKASVLIFLSILEVIACKILKIVLIMKMFTFVLTQEKKLKLRPTNVKKRAREGATHLYVVPLFLVFSLD